MKLTRTISEQQLIRQCKQGDSKAQFAIYKQYYKPMYSVANRILCHSAEAEDIMQEAFLSAFDKLETFNGEVPFGAWLKRIVANKAIDALRKRKMQLEDIDNYAIGKDIANEEPDNQADDKVRLIKHVLQQLPDNQRVLLALHLFEGYSHEEIAELLEMQHGAVRTAYARAKKRLQEQVTLALSMVN